MSDEILKQVLDNIKFGFGAQLLVDEIEKINIELENSLESNGSLIERSRQARFLLYHLTALLRGNHTYIERFTFTGLHLLHNSLSKVYAKLPLVTKILG